MALSDRGWPITLALIFAAMSCAVSDRPRPKPSKAGSSWESCADPEAQRALTDARRAIAAGDDRAAIAGLTEVVTRCPEFVQGHRLYQEAALRVGGDAERAMRAHYAELADDGEDPVVPYVRARLAPDDASTRKLLDEAIARDAGFYFGYLSLGRLMGFHGRSERALDSFQNAVAARPDFADAHLELARSLVELSRWPEAEAHYANYVRANPSDRGAALEYARLLIHRVEKPALALPIIERLRRDDPGDSAIAMDLAAVKWRAGEHEEAAKLYREVLARDRTAARAVLNLGNLYYEPLAKAGGDEGRRAAWSKARIAYRYFLDMERVEGFFDLQDYYAAVPYRLAEIDKALGPLPSDFVARLEDL